MWDAFPSVLRCEEEAAWPDGRGWAFVWLVNTATSLSATMVLHSRNCCPHCSTPAPHLHGFHAPARMKWLKRLKRFTARGGERERDKDKLDRYLTAHGHGWRMAEGWLRVQNSGIEADAGDLDLVPRQVLDAASSKITRG